MNFGFTSTSVIASGGLSYLGTWDSLTNTPSLTSGVGTTGEYYIVSVASNGITTLDGISDWGIGDWVIFSGSAWQKIDNSEQINLSISTQTSSPYQLTLSDAGTLVEMDLVAPNVIEIRLNVAVPFPIGTQILISQLGAGQTQIVPEFGVSLLSAGGKDKLTSQYSGASLIKRDTDIWYLFGDITT